MRRIAAITTLLLAVGFMAYRATAQPAPVLDGPDNPFELRKDVPIYISPDDTQPRPEVDFIAPLVKRSVPGLDEAREPFDAEARVSAMVSEFTNSLNSALRDKVINEEQANRMLKELEVSLTVKRVRLDLLRTTRLLDKLQKDAEGVPGSDEITRLRQHLMSLQESGGNTIVPGPPAHGEPTLAPERK